MEVSLRQLTYYVRLYELRSYTAAAQALGITQPALSISVSQMESALRVPLVERGVQPIGFTEFGEVLFRYAQRVLRDLEHARHDIAAIESGRLGRLDIAIGPSATGLMVGRVLTRMVEDYPQLEIHVQTGILPGVAKGLQNGEFSLYLGTVGTDEMPDQLACEPLVEIAIVPVCGAEHPLVRMKRVTPADLTGFPWIAVGDLDSNLPGWREQFEAVGVQPPEIALEVGNLSLVRDMLTKGNFITLLPESMVGTDVEAGVLAMLRVDPLTWVRQLEMVLRADISLPSAARIFAERLRAAFREERNKKD